MSAAAQLALSLQRMDGSDPPNMQKEMQLNRQVAKHTKIKAEKKK